MAHQHLLWDEPPKLPAREELSASKRKAIDRARQRVQERPAPLEYRLTPMAGGAVRFGPKHGPVAAHDHLARDTFGTNSDAFVDQNVTRLATVMRQGGSDLPTETEVNAAVAAVRGIGPENEAEAQLAVQMAATHEVAMDMLTRAKLAGDIALMERFGTLATKLLRTYTTQLDTLGKLRRGGEQTVRVEHVNVYAGGQAVVGAVAAGGTGGVREKGGQPYGPTEPRALAATPIGPVLCPDAPWHGVPVASGEGPEAVPVARRCPW